MSSVRRLFRVLLRTAVAALLLLAAVALVEYLAGGTITGLLGDVVAVVYVEGEIEESEDTVETLDRLADNDSIRAVVVRVDSPGGAVAPSQEIYDAVFRVRGRKPVVASLGNVAASGGYYVASAAGRIVANAGSLTGSIGVLMQIGNVEELLRKLGVDGVTLTSGRFKDIGSPIRTMTDEERRILEELLGNVHEQFVAAVAKGRGLPVEEVRALADGRVLSGEQALRVKLVDELGGLSDAVRLAAREAGIEGKPSELEFRGGGRWWWQRLFSRFLGSGARPWGVLLFRYAGPLG